jgi:hypothetical protein
VPEVDPRLEGQGLFNGDGDANLAVGSLTPDTASVRLNTAVGVVEAEPSGVTLPRSPWGP